MKCDLCHNESNELYKYSSLNLCADCYCEVKDSSFSDNELNIILGKKINRKGRD